MSNNDSNSSDRQFRPYRTDFKPNFFSLMRQERGFWYVDALDAPTMQGDIQDTDEGVERVRRHARDETHALFWPGCTLSSYSQELTEAVFAFLRERGVAHRMSVRCCGNIIRYAGGRAVSLAYQERLAATLREQGIKRVISACPNCCRCFREITQGMGDVESVNLSEVLVDEGLCILPEQAASLGSVCVHDSCPDRLCGTDAVAVRRLLEGVELREMRHNRGHSRCCGLGRLQFLNDSLSSNRQRRERMREFVETGADQLVTYCFSCTNALQDPHAQFISVHYLELLFNVRVDWSAVYKSSRQILATF